MNNKELKLDWNDISLVPRCISDISSRSEINPYLGENLPLFTAPMDMVLSNDNIDYFSKNKFNMCLPRNIKYEDVKNDSYFYSYGLDEVELLLEEGKLPKRVLIDIANGHMKRLYDLSKRIKEELGDKIELMVGNIANPETYKEYCEIGVDYIRVGVGSGSACTTSANGAIHYPMASLIYECGLISKMYINPTKIIADGGFKGYPDIIKALALGADYVMLGGILNKTIESCGTSYVKSNNLHQRTSSVKIDGNMYTSISDDNAKKLFNDGRIVYKYYRGMSTKEVQISWNKKDIKTGEGISKYNKVEYTLSGWTENFVDYLRTAMSYCGAYNLKEFRDNSEWIQISQMAFNRFHK